MRRAQVVLGVLLERLAAAKLRHADGARTLARAFDPLPIFTSAALRRASIMSTPLLGMVRSDGGAATAARQPLAAAATLSRMLLPLLISASAESAAAAPLRVK